LGQSVGHVVRWRGLLWCSSHGGCAQHHLTSGCVWRRWAEAYSRIDLPHGYHPYLRYIPPATRRSRPTVTGAALCLPRPCAAVQDTAGPMARTVEDAALLLGVLAGPDEGDQATAGQTTPLPDYIATLVRTRERERESTAQHHHCAAPSLRLWPSSRIPVPVPVPVPCSCQRVRPGRERCRECVSKSCAPISARPSRHVLWAWGSRHSSYSRMARSRASARDSSGRCVHVRVAS
jgi:hypothetical protein